MQSFSKLKDAFPFLKKKILLKKSCISIILWATQYVLPASYLLFKRFFEIQFSKRNCIPTTRTRVEGRNGSLEGGVKWKRMRLVLCVDIFAIFADKDSKSVSYQTFSESRLLLSAFRDSPSSYHLVSITFQSRVSIYGFLLNAPHNILYIASTDLEPSGLSAFSNSFIVYNMKRFSKL